ncbi:MAG: glycosyltransferase family protein [Fibrobacter sp.]|uniref:glycosyltransferase family protein n=1 Tax=Fibrobacter sp. TaxID=35828 RepID=UPI002A90A97A|nr:glycosyltransferase family protein [Fibrobacter sp.]MDY6264635.1 glycosyltransferase family protein [Fibrobacter sp.]
MSMNVGIIVQARMGSSRLPGKVLMPFYDNKTLLETLLDSLHKVENVKVVVATSVSKNNDELELFLQQRGEIVFRGAENDVLERFIQAAEKNSIDGIVRICSDNPFMDWKGIDELVKKARLCNADYIGYKVNNTPSILTHFGFWGEFVTLDALKRVFHSTEVGSPAREHVTYHVYKNPSEYYCEWLEAPDCVQGRDDIRLTIDTFDDLQNAKKVYSDLKAINKDFTLQDVVTYLDNHVDVKASMVNNISQNKK